MNDWLFMGRDYLIGNARRRNLQPAEVPAQTVEIDIPWLTALATLLVVAISLCIGLSIVGVVVLQMLD